jgi:hypothetical protein
MKSIGHMVPKLLTSASYWQALLLKAAQQAGLAPWLASAGHAALTSSYETWEKSVGQYSGRNAETRQRSKCENEAWKASLLGNRFKGRKELRLYQTLGKLSLNNQTQPLHFLSLQ